MLVGVSLRTAAIKETTGLGLHDLTRTVDETFVHRVGIIWSDGAYTKNIQYCWPGEGGGVVLFFVHLHLSEISHCSAVHYRK